MVCLANTCRSAMAEAILRHKLTKTGRSDITVSSMGIHGQNGRSPSANSVIACHENGTDLTEHKSRPLIVEELLAAHLVFAMEEFHAMHVLDVAPAARVEVLSQWHAKKSKSTGVIDPYGGSVDDYRKTFKIIEKQIDRILPFLLAEIAQK